MKIIVWSHHALVKSSKFYITKALTLRDINETFIIEVWE